MLLNYIDQCHGEKGTHSKYELECEGVMWRTCEHIHSNGTLPMVGLEYGLTWFNTSINSFQLRLHPRKIVVDTSLQQ